MNYLFNNKSSNTKSRRAAALVAVALSTPATAVAATPGEFPWVHFGVSVLNFVIFLGILLYFAGPKIQAFFGARHVDLVADLNEAKRLREEAEAKLAAYSARLDSLESERKALMDDYHAQGEREREKIIADTKRQVEKMRADAELVIQQDVRKAVAAIELQAVDLAVQMAENTLKTRLDDRTQNLLVDQYVGDMKSLEA